MPLTDSSPAVPGFTTNTPATRYLPPSSTGWTPRMNTGISPLASRNLNFVYGFSPSSITNATTSPTTSTACRSCPSGSPTKSSTNWAHAISTTKARVSRIDVAHAAASRPTGIGGIKQPWRAAFCSQRSIALTTRSIPSGAGSNRFRTNPSFIRDWS